MRELMSSKETARGVREHGSGTVHRLISGVRGNEQQICLRIQWRFSAWVRARATKCNDHLMTIL